MEQVKEAEIVKKGSPSEMILAAVGKGANLADLNAALDLQMKWEQNEARKAFAKSFASAQEKIRAAIRKCVNPQTHSRYADLEAVIESSRPVYTKEGFSVIFYEGETSLPEHVRICADVLHNLGHRETYHYDVPLDGLGIKGNANMTKIHGKASSTSYARRYLMCMIWNLPTQDDDDGNSAAKDALISEEELATINEYLMTKNVDVKKLLGFAGASSLDTILKSNLNKVITALKNAENKK